MIFVRVTLTARISAAMAYCQSAVVRVAEESNVRATIADFVRKDSGAVVESVEHEGRVFANSIDANLLIAPLDEESERVVACTGKAFFAGD